jgi:hypothetical protein
MQRKPLAAHDAQLARFAWWTAFLATLTLVAILGLARSAQALTLPPNPAATSAAPAPVDDEEEAEAEASEDEEFEMDECGEDEACVDEEGVDDATEAPAECILSRAEATVSAAANRDQVRLQIRYTTTSPTPVAVAYGLHGSKGALYLGGDHRRFGRHGVLRLTRDLTDEQMAKVMAAKDFTVRLRVAAAPGYCKAFFDRQLSVRRSTPSGISWEQSE